tara:strand:- start:21 stop:728 length:708 start_codon:yes stop_codon:yes gene_type:complete
MKIKMNTKKNAKTLLIIIILVFSVIPFLFVLLNEMFGIDIREGFRVTLKTNGEDGDDIKLGLESSYPDNTQIDRVKTATDKYKYCIGDVSCSSGSLIKNSPHAYTFNGKKIGYTYQNKCGNADDDSTFVTCEGETSFSQFYGPFDNVPFSVSGNSLTISDDISAAAQTTPTDTSGNTTPNHKCLADNGASVGDPLCCGQDGVVQNTKYNCPAKYPHCIGYKCGETWGKCSPTVAA